MRPFNTTANCECCGREFGTYSWEIKRGRGRFCSHSCAGIIGAISKHATHSQEGSLNPNWKGGRSTDNYYYKLIQKQRYPKETKVREQTYEKIRTGKLVKQPCEICGDTKNIQSHHDNYNKPDEINWLCRNHHKKLHQIAGR